MTNFDDVTRNFTDGLNQISTYIPTFVTHLQDADKTFRQRKEYLMGHDSDKISFAGKGATAFATCVENNIARTKTPVDHWNTLAENTSNLLTQFTYSNNEANPRLSSPFGPPLGSVVAAAKPYYTPTGAIYTPEEAWNEMREAALKGSDMNTVMDQNKGLTYILRKLDDARQNILADIKTQHTNRMNQLDPNNPQAKAEPENYTDAQASVNGFHDQLSGVITKWFNEMTPMLARYEQGIQDNEVSVPRYTPPPALHTRTISFPKYNEKDIIYSGTITNGNFAPVWDPNKGNAGIYTNGRMVLTGRQGVTGNVTFGAEIDGPSGDLQLGEHNGQFGLTGDISALSVTANAGLNVAGGNLSVSGTVQAGVGLGISFKDGVQVNLPFFQGGVTFGPAKQATVPTN